MFTNALRLEIVSPNEPAFWPIGDGLAVQGIPTLVVVGNLPNDLAHTLAVEFEEVPGWRPAGVATFTGQGSGSRRLPLEPPRGGSAPPIGRRGTHRLRLRLEPDPQRGWAHPDIRSLWPGTVETNTVNVEVIRL